MEVVAPHPLRWLVGCPRSPTSCELVSSPPLFEYLYYVIAIYVLLALGCAEELFSIINSIKAFNTRSYTWKAAAHTLHTDIIVKSFYLLWLFTTKFRNVYDYAVSCKRRRCYKSEWVGYLKNIFYQRYVTGEKNGILHPARPVREKGSREEKGCTATTGM